MPRRGQTSGREISRTSLATTNSRAKVRVASKNQRQDKRMSFVPVISLSPARASQEISDEMRAACLRNGFFQITEFNHILSSELLSRTLSASKAFFDLPLEVKSALFKENHICGGYEPYKAMNLDPGDKSGYGHNEGYSVASSGYPTAWPAEQILPGFRATMEEYFTAVNRLAGVVSGYLALGLDLSPDFFGDFFHGQLAHIKLAHYYRPEHSQGDEGSVGVAPHTDWGAITILLQDSVGGLEVFDQDSLRWIKVSARPNTLVVNLGDLLARWTNDRYKSTRHRVTSPPQGIHRYSIPFFSQGHPDYVVQVINSCIRPGEVAKYNPIRAEEYFKLKFESTYSIPALIARDP